MGQERSMRLGKKKWGLHALAVWWSRCSQLGSLQRWLCRLKMEKNAAEQIWRLFFFYLMPTRGAEEDTSKRKQKYGGGNNSKFGYATKVNGTLGRDMETIVERRPNKEGLFGFTEDCGPSHLGPLPNTHALNNCMEVG